MTAPRVCLMCMYFKKDATVNFCGRFHRNIIGDVNSATCGKYQPGYAAKQYEADQARAEQIERAERERKAAAEQLGLFGDGS
jgi:hypothetical protein